MLLKAGSGGLMDVKPGPAIFAGPRTQLITDAGRGLFADQPKRPVM